MNRRWVGPAVVGLAGIVMLALSWRKWPDVVVDFGQQLYLAWQMSAGRVLYEDLACNYGPLAPYANALMFWLFGATTMTLVVWNLAVFGGIAVVLYRLLLRLGTPLSAAVSGVVLMLVFAFSQYVFIGNYNYATPYENSLTVGLLPALLAVLLALRGGGVSLGVCLGLAFLTKPEVFLAAAAGVGGAWLICPRRVLPALGGFAGVLLCAVGVLGWSMPLATAVEGALGSWPALFSSAASELAFYRRGMGIDDAGGNLVALLAAGAVWLVALGAGVGIGLLSKDMGRSAVAVGIVLGVATAFAGFLNLQLWRESVRPLPLAMAVVVGVGIRRRSAVTVAMGAFALVLLFKMLLNARVYHYGFVLAMPATLVAVTAIVAWLPRWLGAGPAAFGVGVGIVAAFVVAHLRWSVPLMAGKTVAVGRGANRVYARPAPGGPVRNAVRLLDRSPGSTVAVFPEGSMINFLTGRPNPTPFYNYMPTGFSIYGEDVIVETLRAAPPDHVVLVHKDTSEFGFRYFGVHYAREVRAWIDEHYLPIETFGAEPFTSGTFGVQVLRRK